MAERMPFGPYCQRTPGCNYYATHDGPCTNFCAGCVDLAKRLQVAEGALEEVDSDERASLRQAEQAINRLEARLAKAEAELVVWQAR